MIPDTRIGHTFGHEIVGVVHEVGSDVQTVAPGDRVMVPFNIYCGSCYFCSRGLFSNCHNVNPNATAVGGIYGYSHTAGGYDGGQAEYVRVPFADVGPKPIPDWLSAEDALMLTDAFSTGYFGAQLGEIAERDTVVVFGAGPVGLSAARSAWFLGHRRGVPRLLREARRMHQTHHHRRRGLSMPYESAKPDRSPSVDELRARIPGWGADSAAEHRGTWQQRDDIGDTGAHWRLPERQPGGEQRERSIEHMMLPPVFGTAQPLHGISGRIRRWAYDRLGETKNTRWLLLVLGDRVEAWGAHLRSFLSAHPDNPVTQTGVLAEPRHHPLRSRFGTGRLDVRHTWMDPIIVAGPWLAAAVLVGAVARRALGRR